MTLEGKTLPMLLGVIMSFWNREIFQSLKSTGVGFELDTIMW